MRSTRISRAVCLCALAGAAAPALADLPAIGSADLVSHFIVDDATVSRDGANNVTAWTAKNDAGIVLNRTGAAANNSNLHYNPLGMQGNPTIEVNDFLVGGTHDNLVLQGSLNRADVLANATIFWLGYFSPGRDGGLTDSSGQYVYSYGADGSDGSQMDFQSDDGFAELFSGSGTQRGDAIDQRAGAYTVWRGTYGDGTGNDHSVHADGTDLNIPTPNGANYGVGGSEDLILFGYQNSSGVSGGFNFVGNISELVIYDGIPSAADTAAIEDYLASRIPAPGSISLLGVYALLAGRRRR